MKITLKDGSVKEYESATTAAEITKTFLWDFTETLAVAELTVQ
jgi:hypothetical protein